MNLILLPILIFIARILDVSLGTIRMIFISKGLKYLAPILGFFEVLIWIIVVSKLMSNVNSSVLYVAYAAGFAAGTYIGMLIEDKLSIGKVLVRISVQKESAKIIEKLKELNYSMTVINGQGYNGKIKMILCIINKKELNKLVLAVKGINSKAFYTIEDLRFAADHNIIGKSPYRPLGFIRKFK